MDEVLREAMEPVFRDLRSTGISLPRVEDNDWAECGAMLRSPDGTGAGVSLDRSAPEFERVAMIADQVQEWVIEELWGRAPTNWPRCPHHPDSHPLEASVRDRVAVWMCPADQTPVAPVGGL
ncbi:hypothetical protein [Actinopolymorpha alba]|uniref:hypothetical protein n=1 Tax=Actinopolymorpha alba TaxID=533267 RepID=UPI000371D849|nr:hypothetical protein [Actinopolymorpha alba]